MERVIGLTLMNDRILRPAFFMENFDGFLGSIAVSVMKKGMKEDATLALIVSTKPPAACGDLTGDRRVRISGTLLLESSGQATPRKDRFENASANPCIS